MNVRSVYTKDAIFLFFCELLMKYLQGNASARVKHVADASNAIKEDPDASPSLVIKKERGVSPNLVIKQEPMSNAVKTVEEKSLFRTVTENGQEIIELLDSDNEMDSDLADDTFEDGISSDTMVGDFDVKMDSDEEQLSFYDREISGSSSTHSSSDSEVDCDASDPGLASNWLDDKISSTVKPGPIKINRQCTVDVVEYISDLPSYWPVPRNKRAYVVDLSNPKFNVYDKNGKLMTVDALIKNAVSDHFLHSHCQYMFNNFLLLGTRFMDRLHRQWPQRFTP